MEGNDSQVQRPFIESISLALRDSIRSVASQRSFLMTTDVETSVKEESLTGTCTICLEDDVELFTLSQCQHSFCVDCLGAFLEGNITDHNLPLVCPERDCGTEIPNSETKKLVKSEAMTKLKRIQRLQAAPDVRECPKCDKLNRPKEPDTTMVECSKCKTQYCLVHHNAHPPSVTCEEYEMVWPSPFSFFFLFVIFLI
eukprot:TRINITY_DN2198_c0_g1_i4.p1 TRINITY_DN2198_c0_g1~~TRINITY_DN2198_c0_g1_i4.p1  ORF type:complete len:221 (-),score=33.42 TRINITY_DN2198_c0_g1_i4:615-1208(-)